MSANLWANLQQMRRDAVLSKVARFFDTDSLLFLRNGDILDSQLLFPRDQLETAINRCQANNNDRLVQQTVTKSAGPSCFNALRQ